MQTTTAPIPTQVQNLTLPRAKWNGLPYNAISLFYSQKFSGKVYKIPVSVADTCPNREGLRGMQTCNFCDVYGSAAYADLQPEPLLVQIEEAKKRVLSRATASQFLIYFQAYTTTFQKVAKLSQEIATALTTSGVVGVVIGTRPDCVSDALLEMLSLYQEKTFVALELGLQSFDDKQLVWMRRGHDTAKSLSAIQKIKNQTNLDLGIHLMFGLPDETDTDIIQAAEITSQLPIQNVKLHNLHVLDHTPLADDFRDGKFIPLDRETYLNKVVLFLEHLNPEIFVHRLAAVASRHSELIAPEWTKKKMETYQRCLDIMKNQNTYQGRKYPLAK